MKWMHLNRLLMASVVGVIAFMSPAKADAEGRTIPTVNIDAILKLEPDFFDQGREQFELEIERLMQHQSDPNVPILTIDDSVELDTDSVELLEEQPTDPDMIPIPSAP
ncbi:MAG: hypothetical protein F6K42_09645 [Leptolyngbya sp. SIO1D8]|nr:hypothetical protein [Leptolyngbya sp. SIO1D8]